MLELPDTPDKPLTQQQEKAFYKMKALLADENKSDELYDAIEASNNGLVISTDIARHLDSEYTKKPAKGKDRDLAPSWDLAWRYAQDRFRRELESKAQRKKVRFMAGGWGAGKTFALRHEPNTKPDLIWDGTLGDEAWAIAMIDLALQQKWKVEIVYVYRDLELALYGAVQRKKDVGRGVPLEKLPKVHRDVQQSILTLTEIYQADKSVSFLYLHNLGIKGIEVGTPKIELIDLELHGALHYLQRHEHYYTETAKSLNKAH